MNIYKTHTHTCDQADTNKNSELYPIVQPFIHICKMKGQWASKNCLSNRYFTIKWRGIGFSFQLAITTAR